LLTVGIPPSYPATGFGYLESGKVADGGADGSEIRHVKRFVEKPDLATAKRYVKSGKFFWNAGMFAWSVGAFLAEAERHAPPLAKFIHDFPRKKAADYIAKNFPTLEPKTSLDFAIMEKAKAVETVVAEFDWDDVGIWTALPKHVASDEAGNTVKGAVMVAGAKN